MLPSYVSCLIKASSVSAHPIRRNIIHRLGIELELERSPDDQLQLVLRGNKQAVKAAIGELEDVVAVPASPLHRI